MTVRLIDVTADNWRAVARVRVTEEQRQFVADTTYYLCLCHYGTTWQPLAIQSSGIVVGFVMWARDDDDGSHWIGGLVVDAAQQGQGFGRAAVDALVQRLRAEHGAHQVALSYQEANTAARALYLSIGFAETGETEDDETVARLSLTS